MDKKSSKKNTFTLNDINRNELHNIILNDYTNYNEKRVQKIHNIIDVINTATIEQITAIESAIKDRKLVLNIFSHK